MQDIGRQFLRRKERRNTGKRETPGDFVYKLGDGGGGI